MLLDFLKIILIHLQERVIEVVACVSAATIGKGEYLGKCLDVGETGGFAGDEGEEGAEQIGDGDDAVAFVRAEVAGLAAGIGGSHYGGDVSKSGGNQRPEDHRCSGAAADGNYAGLEAQV